MAIRERLVYAIDVVTDGASKGLNSFKSSVGEAEGAVGKMKAGASSAFGAVKQYAGVAALAVGGTLVTAGVKSLNMFTDLALSVEKFSKATGLSTEEASRWVEVAGDLGISTDQVQGGFVKLEKAIATAGPAVKSLGIELQRNADGSANMTETMLQAIKALQGVEDPTLKAKAAAELFGRGFAEMSELVLGDASKIKTALGEVSDAKIIDEKEIEKAKRNRENLDRLRDTIEDLALSLGETLGPALEGAADGLESLNTAMTKLKIDKLIALTGKFDDLGTTIGHFFGDLAYGPDVRRANEAITNAFEDGEAAAADFDTTLLDGLTTFDQVHKKVLDLTGSLYAANKVTTEWAETNKKTADAMSELTRSVESFATMSAAADVAAELHKQHVDDVREAIFREGEITVDTTAITEKKKAADDKAAESARRHADAVEAVAEAMDAQRSAALDLVGGDIAVRDAQRRAREAAEELNDVLKDQETDLGEAGAAIDEAADAQLNAASAAADYRAKQMEANGQTVDARTKAQLLMEELQNLAGNLSGPLLAAIQGYIDQLNAIPKTVGTTIVLNKPGRVGDVVGTTRALGGIQKFASGGMVDGPIGKPQLAVVHGGEEVRTPAQQRSGGGDTYQVTFVVQQVLTPQQVMDAVKKHERFAGPGWRSSG